MDYPFVSRLINQRNYDGVIIEYDDTSAKLDENRKEQFFKEAKQYNEELSNGSGISIIDAFAQDHSMEKKYTQLLNIANNGVMGVVDIPKLHVSLPIYHGTSGRHFLTDWWDLDTCMSFSTSWIAKQKDVYKLR